MRRCQQTSYRKIMRLAFAILTLFLIIFRNSIFSEANENSSGKCTSIKKISNGNVNSSKMKIWFHHFFLDMMNWSINPGIQSQRLRLEDEITNSKSRIKLPIPKVPTGIIKATGKNRTTKNNPGLILHRIPNSVRNESFTLFKTQAKHYHFDWIEGTS